MQALSWVLGYTTIWHSEQTYVINISIKLGLALYVICSLATLEAYHIYFPLKKVLQKD